MKRRWRTIVVRSRSFAWWIRNEWIPPNRAQEVCANLEGAPRQALRVRFPDGVSARSGWPHDGCISLGTAGRGGLNLHHPSVARAVIETALDHGFDPDLVGVMQIDDGFAWFDELCRRCQAPEATEVDPPLIASAVAVAAGVEPAAPDAAPRAPLAELIAAIDGARAEAWLAEHAPLEPLWRACADARLLLGVLERTDRTSGVRAACACARTVLHLVWPGNLQPRIAIEIAEAWARGEASREQCRAAADAADAWDTEYPSTPAGDAANAANAAAGAAAYSAAGDDAYDDPDGAAARVAARAANALATASGASWDREFDAALSALADVVRAIAPCPTILP